VAANDKFLRQWIYLCEDKLERVKKMSKNKVPSNETAESKIALSETKFVEMSKVTESTKEPTLKTQVDDDDLSKTEVSTEKVSPLPNRFKKRIFFWFTLLSLRCNF